MPSSKRRVYVVKKAMQYRFILWVAFTVAVAVGIVLSDVLIALHRHAQQMGLTVRVSDLYDPADPLTLVKIILYAAGVWLSSVVLSNRMAGPVYRFEKSAEEVAAGDLTSRVFLRKRDELVDLRDAFNAMVDAVRGKVAGDVACAYRAKKQLETLIESNGLADETKEKLRKVIVEVDRVGKGFKI